MKKLNLFFILVGFFIFGTSLSAQVTLMANDAGGMQPGETVEIDITVANFTDLVSVQFAVRWDPEVVEYSDLKNFGLSGLSNSMTNNGNFGFAQLDEGKLRFSWSDPLGELVTLPDNTALFTIVFELVGNIGDQTSIEITECLDDVPPIEIEIGDENGNPLPDDQIIIINGNVSIGQISTSETETKDFTLFQNNPNPFDKETNIRFSLKNHTDTHLSIYDYTGKVVFEKIATLGSGDHSVKVSRNVFPSAGTYFYRLKTENSDSIRKLIVQ